MSASECWRWRFSAEDLAGEFGDRAETYVEFRKKEKGLAVSQKRVLQCAKGRGKLAKVFCGLVTAVRHRGIDVSGEQPCRNCPYREYVRQIVLGSAKLADVMRPDVGVKKCA